MYKDKEQYKKYQKNYRDTHKRSPQTKSYQAKWQRTLKGQFGQLKGGAKSRNLEMTITFEEFQSLRVLPCYYCSGPLNETGSGLDRLLQEVGYIKENVVPCCWHCNAIKADLENLGFPLSRIIELHAEIRRINKSRIPRRSKKS